MTNESNRNLYREFNPELFLMAERAELSEETAKEVLFQIADYLARGEPLPIGVGEWLANAIRGALTQPEFYTHPSDQNCDVGQALLIALGLHSKSKRKIAFDGDVFNFMNDWIDNYGYTQSQAATKAAKHFGMSVSKAQQSYKKITDLLKKAGLLS